MRIKVGRKAAISLIILMLCGAVGGFINGLLGAGGGIIVVMGLSALFQKAGVNGHSYYATAIAVMLPLSALSAWQYHRAGHLPPISFWHLILPSLLGGALGALLLRRIAPRVLGRIFAAIVLISGIILAV